MARSENTLRKIIAVQEIVLHCKHLGKPQTWIYINVIAPNFYISKSTFDRYMGINAKKELKDLHDGSTNK